MTLKDVIGEFKNHQVNEKTSIGMTIISDGLEFCVNDYSNKYRNFFESTFKEYFLELYPNQIFFGDMYIDGFLNIKELSHLGRLNVEPIIIESNVIYYRVLSNVIGEKVVAIKVLNDV